MSKLSVNSERLQSLSHLAQYIQSHNTKVILFGETHGFVKDETAHIEKIISIANPSLILYELLEDAQCVTQDDFKLYLQTPDEKEFSIVSTYGDIKPVLLAAHKHSTPVFGFDLHNMGRTKPVPKDFSAAQIRAEEELLDKRERHRAKQIERFLAATQGCVLIITGTYHLRKKAPIFNHLTGAIVVVPSLDGSYDFEPESRLQKDLVYEILLQEEYTS